MNLVKYLCVKGKPGNFVRDDFVVGITLTLDCSSDKIVSCMLSSGERRDLYCL